MLKAKGLPFVVVNDPKRLTVPPTESIEICQGNGVPKLVIF